MDKHWARCKVSGSEEGLLLYQSTSGQELKQAWGEWISGLSEWEWFVTMTFRDPRPAAGTWTKPGWGYAKGAWRAFIKVIQPALGELTWVRCFELQHWRGVPHIHALVGNSDPAIPWRQMKEWCWQNYGMARVLPYDPALGASFYICKYVTKELGDIEFSGGLTKNPPEGQS